MNLSWTSQHGLLKQFYIAYGYRCLDNFLKQL